MSTQRLSQCHIDVQAESAISAASASTPMYSRFNMETASGTATTMKIGNFKLIHPEEGVG